MAGRCFSTSRQLLIIGRPGVKPAAEVEFLVTRSRELRIGAWDDRYIHLPVKRAEIMSSALAPCSGVGQPESEALADTAEILAGLCQRVAALERRLVKRRPDSNARRMTRSDKCPYGWKPHPKNPAVLIQDTAEQQSIFRLVEMAQDPKASFRELCRRLDNVGCKRRGGKKWAGAHGLVRSILRREGILTPEDARAAVQRRIEEARARARGERP